MRNTHTELLNFRNHIETKIDWAPHLNVITGPNGSGKTSLIDAIHYLCMSRSFISNSDMYVVNQDESYFMIKGHFEGQIRSEFDVSCSYSRGDGKKIFVNDSPLDRLSDLIGMVPVVTLTPDDKKLTLEGPAERRSFIDSFISQISPAYLRDLIEYRKVRKQRNALLQEFRGPTSVLEAYLEPWNVQLVEAGSRIIAKRYEVLEKLKFYLEKDYAMISGMDLTTNLEYQTFCEPSGNEKEIEQVYYEELEKVQAKEIEREITTVGPHRDEVVFYLDDFELRKYGSQGQHRLFALSLKMAQLHYYSDELDDLPILMLDDVFGDLDLHKTEILLEALQQHKGQIFITSANPVPFEDYVEFDGSDNRFYRVEKGHVTEIEK
ncbi:DNA replication/repair protein RecF [Gracilimonas tropica]|uniref:DNA replication/repair protein RecF n=1 Tax=Gracilimonas tropica TaxID=454600 RepID=UPI00037084D6|nr:DNA replication/repair protein RecF [Gracilimonas tropica]